MSESIREGNTSNPLLESIISVGHAVMRASDFEVVGIATCLSISVMVERLPPSHVSAAVSCLLDAGPNLGTKSQVNLGVANDDDRTLIATEPTPSRPPRCCACLQLTDDNISLVIDIRQDASHSQGSRKTV